MKSLPENKFWDELRSRLSNYTEDPDDNWDLIVSQIPNENRWTRRVVYLLALASISALLLLGGRESFHSPSPTLSQFPRSFTATNEPTESDARCFNTQEVSRAETTEQEKNSIRVYERPTQITRSNYIREYAGEVYVVTDQRVNSVESYAAAGPVTEASFLQTDSSSARFSIRPELAPEKLIMDSVFLVEKDAADTARVLLNEKNSQRRSRFHPDIFVAISPSFAYYKITPSQSDDLFVTRVHQKASLKDRFSLQFDAGMQHTITRTIDIFAGFNYYSQRESLSYSFYTSDVNKIQSSESMSYDLKPAEAKRTVNYSITSLGVSAGAFYLLKDNRLSHRLGAGLLYQREFLGFRDENGSRRSGNNQVAFMIAYRMQTTLTRKIDFFMQSSFTQFVTSYEVANGSFQIKPYRVSVGLGIIYRINMTFKR